MAVLFPYLFLAGGHSREATPDPLPNSAVKISSADGTAVKTVGEQVAAGLFFRSAYYHSTIIGAFFVPVRRVPRWATTTAVEATTIA